MRGGYIYPSLFLISLHVGTLVNESIGARCCEIWKNAGEIQVRVHTFSHRIYFFSLTMMIDSGFKHLWTQSYPMTTQKPEMAVVVLSRKFQPAGGRNKSPPMRALARWLRDCTPIILDSPCS